jgi:hypothetical protein
MPKADQNDITATNVIAFEPRAGRAAEPVDFVPMIEEATRRWTAKQERERPLRKPAAVLGFVRPTLGSQPNDEPPEAA